MDLKDWIRQALDEELARGGDLGDVDADTARYLLRDESGIAVREASALDAPSLAAIGARAFRHAHATLLDPLDLSGDVAARFDEDRLRTELTEPDAHWLVALWDRSITGFAQLRAGTVPIQIHGELPLELQGVYVAPDWMGYGVGSALIRGAMRLASHLGHQCLWVTAWTGNQDAIDFFEGWGFTSVGGRKFRIGRRGTGELVIMTRPVTA